MGLQEDQCLEPSLSHSDSLLLQGTMPAEVATGGADGFVRVCDTRMKQSAASFPPKTTTEVEVQFMATICLNQTLL